MLVLHNSVPQCDLESDLCASSIAELIGEVLNATSFFINIVHFIVLYNLRTLKGKPYWSVLVAMCCADIWLSVSFTLALNCKLRTLLSTVAPFPTLWNLIISILLESGGLFRYMVVCLSAVERYLAICKPFFHQSNIFVRHIGKSLAGLAAIMTTLITSNSIALLSTNGEMALCINPVLGPTFATNILYSVIAAAYVMIVSVVTFVLLTFSWKEIHRLHRTEPQHSSGTKFALKYVSIVNIIFMCVMFPVSAIGIICSVSWSKQLQPAEAIIWITCYSMITYGTVNCLIYAGMCDAYRKTFVRIFIPKICKKERVAVYPQIVDIQQVDVTN